MALPKPTIVIFDMDGTTVRHINLYLLHILEKLDDFGYALSRFWTWLFRRRGKGPIIPKDDEFLNRKKPRLFVHRVLHKVRRKEVDQIVEPCPGIYMVLNFLKKRDIPLGLISNGLGKGYGHDILRKFHLEDYYKTTVFREDMKNSKPHPESILTAIENLNGSITKNDVVWYIGDRHKDMIAALKAREHTKAEIVPLAYGVNAAVAVLKKGLGPDHIIMSYSDLYQRLQTISGGDEGESEGREEEKQKKQRQDEINEV